MRVSRTEDLASHSGPESCVYAGNRVGEALTGGDVGQVLSREKFTTVGDADAMDVVGRQHSFGRYRETGGGPPRSETLRMHPSTSHGNREVPHLAGGGAPVRTGNSEEATR